MVAVVAVVGWHNAGKTTFIEGLVKALKRRGYRVATLKHSGWGFEWDRPGTDTWRMTEAGSDIVAIACGDRWAMLERLDHDLPLREFVSRLPSAVDIVLAEGFKSSSAPKFEVTRDETGAERIATNSNLLALVTESSCGALPGEVRLSPADAEGAVDLLVSCGILQPRPKADL